MLEIEVRDSRTGYLVPGRDAQGTLPDVESSWDVAAAAGAAPLPAGPSPAPKVEFQALKV